jgi:Zn-dependent peptidase ImmA (M78 family)
MQNSVKIAGVKYQVKFREKMLEDFGTLGLCDYNNTIIYLDPTLSPERMQQVFIHELVHGILFEAGFDDQDEDFVNRVGIVLHQVLKDNQLFVEELEGDEEDEELE